MKKCAWFRFAAFALAAMLLAQAVALAEVDKLAISQIVQQGNYVMLYASVQQGDGTPIDEALDVNQFSIQTDKNYSASIYDVARADELADGVAYTFCIDISGSVTDAETEQIRTAIMSMVAGMRENDYARVITIGSSVTQLCEFTQNRDQLNSAISQIDNRDKKTYLYEGLAYALESMRKSFDAMPKRAVIVVFTDGMDDSDGSVGGDELMGNIAEVRVPLYVVGLKGNDKSANLSEVGRIARRSGGALYPYSEMSLQEAIVRIQEEISHTYVFLLEPEEAAFGQQNITWKINYSANGYTVSSANYVYSLTQEGVVFSTPTPAATAISSPSPSPSPIADFTPSPEPTPDDLGDGTISLTEWLGQNVYFIIAGMFVLAALVLLVVLMVRMRSHRRPERGSRDSDPSPREEELSEDISSTVGDDSIEEATIDSPSMYSSEMDDEGTIDEAQNNGVLVQLKISFEGHEKVIEKRVLDKLMLGRGEDAVDVVLGSTSYERKLTSRRHAQILNRPEGLFIQDNGSNNKTYVNGMEVKGECPLKNGDIIRLGNATVQITIVDYQ